MQVYSSAVMQLAGNQIFSYVGILYVGMQVCRNAGMQKQSAVCMKAGFPVFRYAACRYAGM